MSREQGCTNGPGGGQFRAQHRRTNLKYDTCKYKTRGCRLESPTNLSVRLHPISPPSAVVALAQILFAPTAVLLLFSNPACAERSISSEKSTAAQYWNSNIASLFKRAKSPSISFGSSSSSSGSGSYNPLSPNADLPQAPGHPGSPMIIPIAGQPSKYVASNPGAPLFLSLPSSFFQSTPTTAPGSASVSDQASLSSTTSSADPLLFIPGGGAARTSTSTITSSVNMSTVAFPTPSVTGSGQVSEGSQKVPTTSLLATLLALGVTASLWRL